MREHYTNPAIQKAFGVLKTISADEETRRLAEMREDALRNEVSMLNAARREGKIEEKQNVALNMIALGSYSMEQISQVTRLSMDEVLRLKREQHAEAS